MKFSELRLRDFAGSLHHEVLRSLVHGESNNFPYVLLVGKHHNDSIYSRSNTAVRRRAVLEGIEEEAELLLGFFFADAERGEDPFVVAHRSRILQQQCEQLGRHVRGHGLDEQLLARLDAVRGVQTIREVAMAPLPAEDFAKDGLVRHVAAAREGDGRDGADVAVPILEEHPQRRRDGRVVLQLRQPDERRASHAVDGVLALAGTAYLGAVLIGGNGFIAAFVAGLAFGMMVKGACKFVYEFTESEGQLLTWAAFFLLGATLVPDAIAHLTAPMLGLILISLLVVRPFAIWLSLLGTDAHLITKAFFGWFGPRGLATALFALLVMENLPHVLGQDILHLAINAVWISAILHGVTAAPGARWYAAKTKQMAPCAETGHDTLSKEIS